MFRTVLILRGSRCRITADSDDHIDPADLGPLGRPRQLPDHDQLTGNVLQMTCGFAEEVMVVRHVRIEIGPSGLHDDFAQRASIVAVREYTRLAAPERAAIEVQRKALLDLVEGIVCDGIATGDFQVDEPRETARAIISLTMSLVGVYDEIARSLDDVTALYQRLALRLAGASGSPRRA